MPNKSPFQLCAVAVALTLSVAVSTPVRADAELIKAKNCTACHAVDKKLIGPSYKDVAAKYAGDKDAQAKLAKKIRDGGTGVWGQIPDAGESPGLGRRRDQAGRLDPGAEVGVD